MSEPNGPAEEAQRLRARLAELENADDLQDYYVPTAQVAKRKVSFALGIGILILPLVFSWLLLRKGYGVVPRVIGFGWLSLLLVPGLLFQLSSPAEQAATRARWAAEDAKELVDAAKKRAAAVDEKVSVAAQAELRRDYIQSVIDRVPREPEWKSVTIDKISNEHEYNITLDYKYMFNSSRPESDTKIIARAVLAQLVKDGRNPREDDTSVYVWAKQTGIKGETGADLVALFGFTRYDSSSDSLKYEVYKPLFR
jgi:hypothetical protein